MVRKKRLGREFFEVFRRPPEQKTTHFWRSAKARFSVGREDGRRSKEMQTSGRRGLTVSREAVVIAVLVVVGIVVASHVWGYRRGIARARSAPAFGAANERSVGSSVRTPEKGAARHAAGTALSIPAGKGVAAPFWTLRIISDIPRSRAREIAADLRAMGYDAFAYRPRTLRGYTVNVGRFASSRDTRAKELKRKFAAMIYKGNRWFTTCYLTKISDTERIEP